MLSENPIRTALFDFDGTLVFHEPDTSDMISDFCTEIGQPLDIDTERQGRRTRHEYFVDPDIVRRLDGFSPDQFWCHFNRHVLQAIGIQGDRGTDVRIILPASVPARWPAHELTAGSSRAAAR